MRLVEKVSSFFFLSIESLTTSEVIHGKSNESQHFYLIIFNVTTSAMREINSFINIKHITHFIFQIIHGNMSHTSAHLIVRSVVTTTAKAVKEKKVEITEKKKKN